MDRIQIVNIACAAIFVGFVFLAKRLDKHEETEPAIQEQDAPNVINLAEYRLKRKVETDRRVNNGRIRVNNFDGGLQK